MKPDILINGESSNSINVLDRGFQYGDGLFETILVESGCACFLAEHLERLEKGCDVLGFSSVDGNAINVDVKQLVGTDQHGIIKIILSRGVGERGFLPPESPEITRVVSFSRNDKAISKTLETIDLVLCAVRLSRQPLLAGIKHLNQLERVLARNELRGQDAIEGLMLDVSDSVIEGTMSNVFIVKDDVLLTPVLNNAGVSGVIRHCIIEQAVKEGVPCKVEELTLDDIINADEIFMTNSLMPVRGIKKLTIDGVDYMKSSSKYASWALNAVLNAIHMEAKAKGFE